MLTPGRGFSLLHLQCIRIALRLGRKIYERDALILQSDGALEDFASMALG
jgi:hypothetical protein